MWTTDSTSPLLIPTTSSFIIVNFIFSKSNSFVPLFYNESVTNAKAIFVPNTTKLQFYCEYNCECETTPCLQIIIIIWARDRTKLEKIAAFNFDSQLYERNTPQFSMKAAE